MQCALALDSKVVRRGDNVGSRIRETCCVPGIFPSAAIADLLVFASAGWGLAIQKIKLACGVRSVCQRLSAADVSDRVAAGAQEWRGRPLFAYVRENRAGVYAFASMADKCVS